MRGREERKGKERKADKDGRETGGGRGGRGLYNYFTESDVRTLLCSCTLGRHG